MVKDRRTKKVLNWLLSSGGSDPSPARIQAVIDAYVADPVLSGLSLTEDEYEALNYYENRTYTLDNGAVYNRATLVTPPTDVYGGSDIHVSLSGNDTTGTGTVGNPYRTVSKGIDVAPAGGGITIWLHGGTFVENAGASGYLLKTNKSFTSPIKIKGIQGATSTITATSGVRVIYFSGTNARVIFQNVTIQAIASTTNAVQGDTWTNFEFRDCRILDDASGSTSSFNITGAGSSGLKVKRCTITSAAGTFNIGLTNMNSATVIGNTFSGGNAGLGGASGGSSGTFHFNNNTVNCTGGFGINFGALNVAGVTINVKRNTIVNTGVSGRGVYIVGGSATNSVQIHVDSNTIEAEEGIIVRDYIDGGTINGNNVTSDGLIGIAAPDDGHSTTTFSTRNLNVSYNQVVCTGTNGHTFLFGTVSDHNTCTYNIFDGRNGGAYAIVAKGSFHQVNNCVLYGGSNSSLLLKQCDNYTIKDNYVYQQGSGWAFRFDTTVPIPASNSITDNIFVAIQTGAEIFFISASSIGANNFVDRNKYYPDPTSSGWGELLAAPDPTTIAEVRARWSANYPTGATNDANSSALVSLPT